MGKRIIDEELVGQERKIALVAILGVTPSVLSEAVWALAHQEQPVIPNEILVLTTGTGERKLRETLGVHRACGGVWNDLKKNLVAEGHDLEEKLIVKVRLFEDRCGKLLEDLPTEEANLQAADMMMKELRDYTDDDGWGVYGLLAGGRKTMSALFFSCMCLLGRCDDRIYHVLVSEGYDAPLDPPFCYPKKGLVHRDRNGREFPSEKGHVNLFSVPFVPMGEWCHRKCLGRRLSYSSLINSVRSSMDEALMPSLTVDFAHKSLLLVDGKPRKISETEMLVFISYLQTLDEDEAKRRLLDLQFLLDPEEDGEKYIDEMSAAAPWLEKLVKNQIFYRPDSKDQKRLCAHDFAQRKNSLSRKLPEIVSRRLFAGSMSVADVEWRNLDCVKKAVLEKIFFKGMPKTRPGA